mmetsp:Transcript_27828/g.64876  ORF Transcript_27828/g.64876 Transcript_27828/m.64876 type:complete len:84 (-) Transcript_27828:211-462(-)
MRSRANIVLDQHAIRVGIKKLLFPRRMCSGLSPRLCPRRTGLEMSRMTSTSPPRRTNSASLLDEVVEARSAYIWFACQSDIEK